MNLIFEDAGLAKTLRERFDADVARARPVSLESLGRRSWLERLRDRLAALLLRWI